MGGFVLRTNGRSSQAWPPPTDDPQERLAGAFGRMDGERLFTFLLWQLPADVSFEGGLGGATPVEFIQCAGSADALAVEVREHDATAGDYVLSVLGRAGEEPGQKDVTIRWRDHSTLIHRNERWTSDGATELFLAWWRNGGAVPDGVLRRPIERFAR